jgi:hypothetical protein
MKDLLLESENGDSDSACIVARGSGSFVTNTKNWALFTSESEKCSIFAIRGSTPGLDHVVNLDCDKVPFQIGSEVCTFHVYSYQKIPL